MKLPDFLQDTGLNRLRRSMGTDQYGEFELFDPEKQLTYAEREALEETGLTIHSASLRVLKDKTLAFKNTRIWLRDGDDYHLAYCQRVQSLRHKTDDLSAGTGAMSAHKDHGACLECLAVLQYQGIDSRRLRRAEFSEQIREQFSLAEFQQQYPFYPIV